ncbi:MAG: hypothetical protein C0513_04460 [Isosphaera sp.]|nr:hypothetical protein [Isosphaera sp.]
MRTTCTYSGETRVRRAARAFAWCVAVFVTAGAAVGRAAADPAGVVRRYGESTTLVVARIDLERARPAEFLDWVVRLAQGLPEGSSLRRDAQENAEAVRQAGQSAEDLRQRLVGAGAREAVLLWPLTGTAEPYPMLVLETSDAAAAARVHNAIPLSRMRPAADQPDGPDGPTFVKRVIVTDVVIAAAGPARRLKPVADADPATVALAGLVSETLRDGPAIHLVMSPSSDVRRVLEETLPTLGPELGGSPVTAVTRGIEWMTLGIEVSSSPRLDFVIQAASERAAVDLHNLLKQTRAMIMAAFQQRRPAVLELQGELLLLAAVADHLLPAQHADVLKLSLPAEGLERMITAQVVPMIERARQASEQLLAMSDVRALVIALYAYEDQHKQLPDSIDALAQVGHVLPRQLVSPRGGTRYVYRKPALPLNKLESPEKVVLVHESFEGAAREFYVAAFADGHAEVLPLAELKERIGQP